MSIVTLVTNAINWGIWIIYVVVLATILNLKFVHTPTAIIVVQIITIYSGLCVYYANEVEKYYELKRHINFPLLKDWWIIPLAPFYMLYTMPFVYVLVVMAGILAEVLVLILSIIDIEEGGFDWVLFAFELDTTILVYALVKIYFYGPEPEKDPNSGLTAFKVAISPYLFILDTHYSFREYVRRVKRHWHEQRGLFIQERYKNV
jgi:hypothetical protein